MCLAKKLWSYSRNIISDFSKFNNDFQICNKPVGGVSTKNWRNWKNWKNLGGAAIKSQISHFVKIPPPGCDTGYDTLIR